MTSYFQQQQQAEEYASAYSAPPPPLGTPLPSMWDYIDKSAPEWRGYVPSIFDGDELDLVGKKTNVNKALALFNLM